MEVLKGRRSVTIVYHNGINIAKYLVYWYCVRKCKKNERAIQRDSVRANILNFD